MPDSDKPCPCDSGQLYVACCQPYLKGTKKAPTAESLMRSRYAAYVVGAIDYLVKTRYPAMRRTDLWIDYQETHTTIQWVGLAVVAVSQGGETDKTGKVEFRASYIQDGKTAVHHEHSRFRRHCGAWCYLDGQFK